MYFESVEAALSGAKLILLLGADVDVDLWNVKTEVLLPPGKTVPAEKEK